MSSILTTSSNINDETIRFFSFITQPSVLKSIKTIKDLKIENENGRIAVLRDLCFKNNLECFKLIGESKNLNWELFYIDLETPVLFSPIFNTTLEKYDFNRFSTISKNIKANLLQYYSQDVEIMFIYIKKIRDKKKLSFYIYKLEDQNKSRFTDRKSLKKENQIILEKGKKRVPFGTRNPKNKLNLYTGREWVKFSKSWFVHRPPSRKGNEILHPAKFPETMIRQFITFFTKPGELVLDPFLGSGSTLITAKQSNRAGIGIELSKKYAEISKQRLEKIDIQAYPPLYQTNESSYWKVIHGNSKNLLKIWDEVSFPQVDFCITSPPYWNQLERNAIRQKSRKDLGLDTKYSVEDSDDLGNVKDYDDFIAVQQEIFGQVHEILRPKGYLVIIVNNVFFNGQVYPLAYDTAISLTHDTKHSWVLKDEKIWLQDDKALVALGVNYAWVGNRCHQYCHIFRKE
ncbi:MAG: DNA methyltransferase [Candidatus Hodarchaeota archaeon]